MNAKHSVPALLPILWIVVAGIPGIVLQCRITAGESYLRPLLLLLQMHP